jgi:folylpolyglutamate synthase/dihydropteroate synthase
VVRDPDEALERALDMAAPDDAIFATGSLYLVGDLRGYWLKHKGKENTSTAKICS